MNNLSIQFEFAKWLMNENNTNIPKKIIEIFNEDEILSFLSEHRLIMLFYNKFLFNKSDIFSSALYNKVESEAKKLEQSILEKKELLRKINKIYLQKGVNDLPIIIKGISSYLVGKKDSRLIKKSNDIDIVTADSNKFRELVNILNVTEPLHSKARHEEAILFIEEIMIEDHNSFPVLHIPIIEMKSGIGKKIEVIPIKYSDLNNDSLIIDDIKIPSIEMTVFILCAHLYCDYLNQVYIIPRIRLSDLYAINYLSTSDEFNKEKFINLIKKYNSEVLMAFINEIGHYYFGNNWLFSDISVLQFPLKLKIANDLFGPFIQVQKDDYFKHLAFYNFFDIIDNLQINNINNIKTDQWYQTKQLNTYRHVEKEMINETNCSFICRILGQKMIFEFLINGKPSLLDNVFVAYSKNFGHLHFWENKYGSLENVVFGLFDNAEYNIEIKQDSYTVKFIFSYNDISVLKRVILVYENLIDSYRSQVCIPICIYQ